MDNTFKKPILYPVMMNLRGKLCVVIGGGKIALQKLETLVLTGAVIRIIAPEITPVIRDLGKDCLLEIMERKYQPGDLRDADLVIGATNNKTVNLQVYQEALNRKLWVNIVDTPELCLFQVPAVYKQDELMIAISTTGKSPALASKIRRDLEQLYGPEYGLLLKWIDRWRSRLKNIKSINGKQRNRIFTRIMEIYPIDLIKTLDPDAAEKQFDLIMGRLTRNELKSGHQHRVETN